MMTDTCRYYLTMAHKIYTDLVMKFCKRYSGNAHSILATAHLAPALHFCSMITRGVFMVVMDVAKGCNAYQKFKHKELPSAVHH